MAEPLQGHPPASLPQRCVNTYWCQKEQADHRSRTRLPRSQPVPWMMKRYLNEGGLGSWGFTTENLSGRIGLRNPRSWHQDARRARLLHLHSFFLSWGDFQLTSNSRLSWDVNFHPFYHLCSTTIVPSITADSPTGSTSIRTARPLLRKPQERGEANSSSTFCSSMP